MSNRHKLLLDIRDYLTRFTVEVKIATAAGEYDLNKHAETIMIPVLNIIYNADFKNANATERKNFASLDLIDDHSRFGVQVTASNTLEKVKHTLGKFIERGLDKRVNRVMMLILTEKQRNYSIEAISKVTRKKVRFNVDRDIVSLTDLYPLISCLVDINKVMRIRELLEMEFSDIFLGDNFHYKDYENFRAQYQEKCLINFSRLNFFGLSVSKRPREVELYGIFVTPAIAFRTSLTYWR
ncbi:SMEK domain-containing protein [Mucilaginibacter pedocola]|uniref:SMEK domain-containing protein n=1 Tax=Mucilaginibacter pedocola TaxID=1792845 RepID=A0A1S9PFV9_9SPHI|nr:SMEK domain-containing protein [Mucilaginibacter pedocola]OOQ59841.1 hypothetical protein BC343_06760 [Mucilaginibacter pedocola]